MIGGRRACERYAIPSEECQVGDAITSFPAGNIKIFWEFFVSMLKSTPSCKGMVPFCSREGIDILNPRMIRSWEAFPRWGAILTNGFSPTE